MKENLLFIATTEYQMLVSFNYIIKNYHDRNRYSITFLRLSEVNVGRIDKQEIDLKKVDLDIEFIRIEFSYLSNLPNPNLKRLLNYILEKKYQKLYFGFELDFISIYLINILKKNEAKINLYPDGIKAYTKWKGNAGWKSRVLMSMRYLKFLWTNNLNFYTIEKFSYQYADMHQIDAVITQYPKKYHNFNNKEIISFDLLEDKEIEWKLKRIFKFPEHLMNIDQDVIVYLATHSKYYKEEEVANFELETLKLLRQNHPEKKIYFKPHPVHISTRLIEGIKRIENLIVVNENIPGELFVSAFINTTFVSMFSTTFLVHPASNQFIWTWKYAKARGLVPDTFELGNPTDFIIEINNLKDLIFLQPIYGY